MDNAERDTLVQEQLVLTGNDTLQTRLFHGTNARHLPSILQGGLRPRGKRESNWGEYESRADLVYLTKAYAPYFAMNCTDPAEESVVILEIDGNRLRPSLFLPDEDYISQALVYQAKRKGDELSLDETHFGVRDSLEDYQHHAIDSLRDLGNVAYKGTVPVSAITRYCVFSPKQQAALAWAACDPMITPMNYRLCGEKYRQMTAWLFGDRNDWQVGHGDNEQFFQMMDGMQPGFSARFRKQFADRTGISVTRMGVSDE